MPLMLSPSPIILYGKKEEIYKSKDAQITDQIVHFQSSRNCFFNTSSVHSQVFFAMPASQASREGAATLQYGTKYSPLTFLASISAAAAQKICVNAPFFASIETVLRKTLRKPVRSFWTLASRLRDSSVATIPGWTALM